MHSKNYASKFAKPTYNLERREYIVANIIIYCSAKSACLGELKWKLFDNFVFVS